MTFGPLALLIAFGLGVVATMACYIYLNRTRPGQVDKAEDVVRNIHKPF
jgi:hypothetical protein